MNIYEEIMAAQENQEFTAKNWIPLFSTPSTAKIIIIGQAPSLRVQNSTIMWDDASGDRLREWLGISRDEFYNSGYISVIPMDFYYPGKGKSGDLPPRPGIAQKWHPRLLAQMTEVKLIILIGAYAQKYYLKLPSSAKTTDIIRNYQAYLPEYFPIVHPSPRNNIWLKKNEWFVQDVVPDLQKKVRAIFQNK
ncbi:MAG: uracil-DNA glycosylase family protein [Mycoplasmatales bacterium]